jgi:hypothetical protein
MRQELAIGHYLLPQIIQQAILNHRWVLRVVPSLFAYAHCLTAFTNRSSTPSTVSSKVLSSNFPVLHRLAISDFASEFSSSFIPRNIRDLVTLPSVMYNFCRRSNLRFTVYSGAIHIPNPGPFLCTSDADPVNTIVWLRSLCQKADNPYQPWITKMKSTTNGVDTTTYMIRRAVSGAARTTSVPRPAVASYVIGPERNLHTSAYVCNSK